MVDAGTVLVVFNNNDAAAHALREHQGDGQRLKFNLRRYRVSVSLMPSSGPPQMMSAAASALACVDPTLQSGQ